MKPLDSVCTILKIKLFVCFKGAFECRISAAALDAKAFKADLMKTLPAVRH